MDNGLGANDPYRGMESGEQEIKPEFLTGKDNAARKVFSAAESVASAKGAAEGAAKKAGEKAAESGAKKAAEGGAKKAAEGGAKKADEAKNDKSLYNNGKNDEKSDDDGSLKIPNSLKVAGPFVIVFISVAAIIGLVVGLPIMMIGAIDYNLKKALGFLSTAVTLVEQGIRVVAEFLADGEFPSQYASELAAGGIDVGQVTASGDFVKTNTYIANIGEQEGLVAAASGFSYISEDEGELAVLYNGKVIRADEFVAAVDSDPELYAVYTSASDIKTKYYYGKDVSDVYKDMKISRGSFNDWEQTGDYKTDEASFKKILDKTLDNDRTNVDLGGVHDDKPPSFLTSLFAVIGSWFGIGDGSPGNFDDDITSSSASDIISNITSHVKKYIVGWHTDVCTRSVYNPTTGKYETETYNCQKPDYDSTVNQRAANLLNTAISAVEPFKAANVFTTVAQVLQRAMIGDNGPVNQMMNTLSSPSTTKYRDVVTGNNVTKKQSILETQNFQAAVGERDYSTDEAANFSRDRALQATGQKDTGDMGDVIKNTTISSNGKKDSSSVVRNGNESSASEDVIKKATDSVDYAIAKDTSESFEGIVGGNRIVEGGGFLSNNINQKVIGSMPSDEATVAAYQAVVDEEIARYEESERAIRSPFDISSPYTFMGSIVSKLATSVISVYGSGATSAFSAVQATGNVASDAVASLMGSAYAEGVDQKYETLGSSNCKTTGMIGVYSDIYCSSHNTVSTAYMDYTMDDWKSSGIGSSLEDDGKIKKDSDLEKFVIMGMDRDSTVGTKNGDVCTAYHNYNDGVFKKIVHFFKNILGLYQACDGVGDLANGTTYSFTSGKDGNLALYSGYMLYNQVYTLLSDGDTTAVADARERYYAEHPKDESEAGYLARISGLSKEEAEIALSYAGYLNEIASYDPSGRYDFVNVDLGIADNQPLLETHSNEVAGNLYAWYQKETEYKDVRNRQEMTA